MWPMYGRTVVEKSEQSLKVFTTGKAIAMICGRSS
jgi:hypothetical protein